MNTTPQNEGCRMLPLKRYSLKELCALYRVHRNTFLEWLKPFKEEIGQRDGNFYTVAQVKVIFKKLDFPDLPDQPGEINPSEDTKVAA